MGAKPNRNAETHLRIGHSRRKLQIGGAGGYSWEAYSQGGGGSSSRFPTAGRLQTSDALPPQEVPARSLAGRLQARSVSSGDGGSQPHVLPPGLRAGLLGLGAVVRQASQEQSPGLVWPRARRWQPDARAQPWPKPAAGAVQGTLSRGWDLRPHENLQCKHMYTEKEFRHRTLPPNTQF